MSISHTLDGSIESIGINILIKIKVFLDRISDLIDLNNIEKALEVYHSLLRCIEENDAEIKEKGVAYVELASFMFQKTDYLCCIENLKRAQENDYSLIEIETFIFEAFIEPNIENYKQNYKYNSELFKSNGIIDKIIPFEELNYFFIPTFANDQYFIFNKKEKCIGQCLSLESPPLSIRVKEKDVFSDHLIAGMDDFCQLAPILNVINEVGKKVYVLPEDVNSLFSFLQLEELKRLEDNNFVIFHSEHDLKEYFMATNRYLPRNIHDNLPDKPFGEKIVTEIHKYRLTEEGRNGKNVLLTIGIPSWNRGNRALNAVLKALESEYDEEIEILISNNGSGNDTKGDYDAIDTFDDSRITYIKLENNIGFALNVCNVIEKSNGRFVLMQSDEDHVLIRQLPLILKRLQENKKQLAVLKTKTNNQGIVRSTELTKTVRKSCELYAFSSNYLSGLIFNVQIALESGIVDFIKNNYEKNIVCNQYPHMVIELLLTQFGHIKGEDNVLIQEGKSEGIWNNAKIPEPTAIEGELGRITQHNDWISIIEKMSLGMEDFILMQILVLSICWKTLFLSALAHKFYYKNMGIGIEQILDKAHKASKKSIKKVHIKYGKKLTPAQHWYSFLDNSYEEIYNMFEK